MNINKKILYSLDSTTAIYGTYIDSLFAAAEYGFLEPIRYLIESEHVDINFLNVRDHVFILIRLFLIAAENNHFDIVKYLMENNSELYNNVNFKDTYSKILYYAIQYENLDIIKFLIEYRVNVNAETVYFRTPLMYAAGFDNLEMLEDSHRVQIVRLLIDAGADVNAKDRDGRTALMYAVENRRRPSIKKSMLSPDSVEIHVKIVRVLIDSGADIEARDKDGRTILHIAAKGGNLNVVEYLIEKIGIDPNARDNEGGTALHIAALYKHHNIVKFFIDLGVYVDIEDNNHRTPLMYATRDDDRKSLYKWIWNPNISRELLLKVHLQFKDDLNVFKLLLENGANINARDIFLTTPLHYAAQCGNAVVVRFLLDNGADINIGDDNGETPLMYAEENGYFDVVRILTEL